jgi:outer membrane lipoprotein-sorting protein
MLVVMKKPVSLRRTATWTAPVVAAAAFIAAGPVSGLVNRAASAELPPRSAAQLLVDVQKANVDGFSGTVVEQADLGLPDLPQTLTGGATGPTSLLTGSHTLRVWYAGPQQGRVSLLSQYGESDLIHSGSDLWQWSSTDRTAQHWTLPAHHEAEQTPAQAQLTPQQAADQALAALSPTTRVTGDGTTTVAGREAYVLRLEPRSATTLVGSVRIAIDGKTHIPTQVQVFAKKATKPAISIGFSSFDPGTPPASVFTFNPPPGTTVKQEKVPDRQPASHVAGPTGHVGEGARVVGTGWGRVVVATLHDDGSPNGEKSSELAGMLRQLPRVSGSWGSGRLLEGPLLSVVVTDDHRVAAGAVPPEQLYAALGTR